MGYTLTLSQIDAELLRQLRSEADRRRVAVEAVAEEWLRLGAAARKPTPKITPEDRAALLAMAGTWSKEEADEFEKATEIFRRIDEEMWK